MSQLFEHTIWYHILFGKDESGNSLMYELQDGEIDNLLRLLANLAKIFKCPIETDDSENVKNYLQRKISNYDKDKIYYIPMHLGFEFLRSFIKDGKIEDGVESFAYRIAQNIDGRPRNNPTYEYVHMMYYIIKFYNCGILPLTALESIDYYSYQRLAPIFKVYYNNRSIFDINSQYFISYDKFTQMSEKKQEFISTYFSTHNYSMGGKSIEQLMQDQLLTVSDLISLNDDDHFATKINEIVRNNTVE